MPNILTEDYNRDNLHVAPIFSKPINYGSSERQQALNSVPRLQITNCFKVVKKFGSSLTIDTNVYDLSYKNILDVVEILRAEGVNAQFLDNTIGWDLPALCMSDFLTQENNECDLNHLPFNVDTNIAFQGQGIIALNEIKSPILVIDSYQKKKPYESNSNFITKVTDYKVTDKVLLKVLTTDFLIKVNPNTFTTIKTDTITRHMDKTKS